MKVVGRQLHWVSDEIKVHVTTFSILHKLFSIEIYGYCEVIGLDRWTRGEITDPSYSELTYHE